VFLSLWAEVQSSSKGAKISLLGVKVECPAGVLMLRLCKVALHILSAGRYYTARTSVNALAYRKGAIFGSTHALTHRSRIPILCSLRLMNENAPIKTIANQSLKEEITDERYAKSQISREARAPERKAARD
jgi:hypothetical protein